MLLKALRQDLGRREERDEGKMQKGEKIHRD